MFIDPDPLCPAHGHLCCTQERPPPRHHPSTRSLLLPLERWDVTDPGGGGGSGAEGPRCPGCDRPFAAAELCHCDCARPDVAADVVDRLPSPPPPLDAATSTLPPPAMLQTDDLKLQKTRRKSTPTAGVNSTSAAARKHSAADDGRPSTGTAGRHAGCPSTGAARRHAGEVEPLLITAADDDDGPEVTSSPRRVTNSSAVCRGVEMPRTDHGGGDVTRTIA